MQGDDEVWLTSYQAGEFLGLSHRTVTRQADSGKLACTWTGGAPGKGHRRFALSVLRRVREAEEYRLAAEVHREEP